LFAAKVSTATDDRLMVPAIAAVLGAAVLAGWRGGGLSAQAGGICALTLALFELGNGSSYFLPSRAVPEQNPYLHRLAEHGDIIAYIRNRGLPGRIEYDDNDIPYNIGDWYGVETFASYTASVTANVWGADTFSHKDFYGIRYYLGKQPQRPDQKELFTGRSGLKVFENPTAMPRVWSTAEAAGCDPANDDVQLPVHQPNFVRIMAEMKCPGTVVLTDTWFPGWRATVDRKPAPILEIPGGVRGVRVTAGSHTIEMRYRPLSVFLGAGLSILAAVLTLLSLKLGI